MKPTPPKPKSVDFASLAVLLVENNRRMRELLREMLSAFGVPEIWEAGTVEEAERIVTDRKFDFVVLDYFLDGLDGADFTRFVRRREKGLNRTVPILLLTAMPNHSKVVKMRDAGVNDIVAKPVSPRTLYTHMHHILAMPRPFVITRNYVGPCRRRKKLDVPPELDRRRRRAA